MRQQKTEAKAVEVGQSQKEKVKASSDVKNFRW